MNQNLTEIVFILDESGSMIPFVNDTIGGYNSFLDKQKGEQGDAYITTVMFSSEYFYLHNHQNVKEVEPLDTTTYQPGGVTALLDAVGSTIDAVGKRLANTKEENRPAKVIFVIITDGEENASREYTYQMVKDKIQHQTDVYSWEFLFLGANIDSAAMGRSIGISEINTADYAYSAKGIDSVYATLSNAVSNYRATGCLDSTWADSIIK